LCFQDEHRISVENRNLTLWSGLFWVSSRHSPLIWAHSSDFFSGGLLGPRAAFCGILRHHCLGVRALQRPDYS